MYGEVPPNRSREIISTAAILGRTPRKVGCALSLQLQKLNPNSNTIFTQWSVVFKAGMFPTA